MPLRGMLNDIVNHKTAYEAAGENGIDLHHMEYLLTLTPLERLMRHEAALELVQAARKAGIQYYGFDPRYPERP